MRIAVIGGTGLVGRRTVEAVKRAGHDAVVVARSHGVEARLASTTFDTWLASQTRS
jgi:uncharacterized protein YbjT (DUF2867 family)